MTYDDVLERDIKRHTDAPEYLWDYTYRNLQAEHSTLPDASTKQGAIRNIDYLVDELIDTMAYIKGLDEWEVA